MLHTIRLNIKFINKFSLTVDLTYNAEVMCCKHRNWYRRLFSASVLLYFDYLLSKNQCFKHDFDQNVTYKWFLNFKENQFQIYIHIWHQDFLKKYECILLYPFKNYHIKWVLYSWRTLQTRFWPKLDVKMLLINDF